MEHQCVDILLSCDGQYGNEPPLTRSTMPLQALHHTLMFGQLAEDVQVACLSINKDDQLLSILKIFNLIHFFIHFPARQFNAPQTHCTEQNTLDDPRFRITNASIPTTLDSRAVQRRHNRRVRPLLESWIRGNR